jgi:hypothetical protein
MDPGLATTKRITAAIARISAIVDGGDQRKFDAILPIAVQLILCVTARAAYSAFASRIADRKWRWVVAEAVARFLVLARFEATPTARELRARREHARRALVETRNLLRRSFKQGDPGAAELRVSTPDQRCIGWPE